MLLVRATPPAAPGSAVRDEEVVAALAAVFARVERVETQRKLRDLVAKELARKRPGAKGVSGQRVRLLAIRARLVRVETRTKVGDGADAAKGCPVCQGKLRKVRNRTLTGGQVLVGLRCPLCGYRAGAKLAVPTKYVFHAA